MDRTNAPGNVGRLFVAPDVATGVPGTDLEAVWHNNVQESIVRAIERAGITPADGDDTHDANYSQLADALNVLAGRVLSAAQKNLLINPGFDLWQASPNSPPSFTLDSAGGANPAVAYTADQWVAYVGDSSTGAGTVSRGTVNPGQGVAPHSTRSTLIFAQTTARAPGNPKLAQRMELLEEVDGLSLTFSAAFKVASGTLQLTPYVRQVFGSGGSADVVTTGTPFTVTNTTTRFASTLAVPSIAGKTVGAGAYTEFGWEATDGGTFTLTAAGAQLEYGTVATDWSMPDLTTDLQRARRYYYKTYEPGTAILTATSVGSKHSQDAGADMPELEVRFPVAMRTRPAITWVSPLTGATGKVQRPPGSDANVTSTLDTSIDASGMPITSGVTGSEALAHLIADARL